MWGGGEEGKIRRRILICRGFWPQKDVTSAGAGGGRRREHGRGERSGWFHWHAAVLTLQVHGGPFQLNPYWDDVQ